MLNILKKRIKSVKNLIKDKENVKNLIKDTENVNNLINKKQKKFLLKKKVKKKHRYLFLLHYNFICNLLNVEVTWP